MKFESSWRKIRTALLSLLLIGSAFVAVPNITEKASAVSFFQEDFDSGILVGWTIQGGSYWHMANDSGLNPDTCMQQGDGVTSYLGHPKTNLNSPGSMAYHIDPPNIGGPDCTYDDGNAGGNTGWLETPSVDMGPAGARYFSFWYWYDLDGTQDRIEVYGAGDNALPFPVGWANLGDMATVGYRMGMWNFIELNVSAFSGDNSVWYRFYFDTNGNNNNNQYAGWYIDDVIIDDLPTIKSHFIGTSTPPAADGIYNSGEYIMNGLQVSNWVNLSMVPGNQVPAFLIIENDMNNFYIVYDVVGDNVSEPNDGSHISFDALNDDVVGGDDQEWGMDGVFPPTGPYHYVAGGFVDPCVLPVVCASGFGPSDNDASAHMIYEFMVPITSLLMIPYPALPLDYTMGFAGGAGPSGMNAGVYDWNAAVPQVDQWPVNIGGMPLPLILYGDLLLGFPTILANDYPLRQTAPNPGSSVDEYDKFQYEVNNWDHAVVGIRQTTFGVGDDCNLGNYADISFIAPAVANSVATTDNVDLIGMDKSTYFSPPNIGARVNWSAGATLDDYDIEMENDFDDHNVTDTWNGSMVSRQEGLEVLDGFELYTTANGIYNITLNMDASLDLDLFLFNLTAIAAEGSRTGPLPLASSETDGVGVTEAINLVYLYTGIDYLLVVTNENAGTGNYRFDNPPIIESWEPGGTGGQFYIQGDIVNVTWTASDVDPLPANPINITYGVAPVWTTIATDEANDGIYGWDTTTVSCPGTYWMNLSAYDSIGQTTFDESNNSFDIVCPDDQPTIEAWEPGGTGGQTYTQGDIVDVTWNASDDNPLPANPINITYGVSPTWTPIANDEADDGIYLWDTSAVPCPGTYWMNLSVYDSGGQETFDVGNFSFDIICDNPPSIEAWEPGGTGGQTYTQGDIVNVTWNASDDNPLPANPINITYGVAPTWTTIATDEADDGIYLWDTSAVPCPGTYWMNLSVYDSRGQTTFNESNNSFDIICDNPPSIEAWEPGGTGGQTYTQGDVVNVTWNASDDNPLPANPINITYGVSPVWTTIATDEAEDGIYLWDTSAVPCPGTYWMNLSVYDSIGQTTFDESNNTFDITCPVDNPPTIEAWEPGGLGGQTYTQGDMVNVTWNASDDNPLPPFPINITYGVPGSWTTIATDEADDGIYLWDTSAVPCPGTYWMNLSVYDSIGQTTFDEGNFSFDVFCPGDSPPIIEAWEPGGTVGQTYTQGVIITVTWNASDDNPLPPLPINITYGDPGGWTAIATDEADDGVYSWDTAAVPCPGTYWMNLSVYDSIGQTTFNEGNESFTIFCPGDSPPTITVYEPGGTSGQTHTQADIITVTWNATDDNPLPPNPINITYGNTTVGWTTIATDDANDGTYSWDTAGVTCPGIYWMNLSVYDSIGQTTFDEGNYSFNITCPVDNPPTIEAWEPGGTIGQTYTQGDIITVTWNASDDNPLPPLPINITYGDPVGGWTTIATDEADDGIYSWDTVAVPCPFTYWMNLSVYDSIGQTTFDEGNFSFDISCADNPPTIEAWEPGGSGGQTYTQGDIITVTWNASDDNPLPPFPINITYGSGAIWNTISTDEANDGTYSWGTSAVPCPGSFWINFSVYDSIGQMIFDAGNFSFDIFCPGDSPPTITAYEPGGTSGQSYLQGTIIIVTWTASDDNPLPANPINITYGDPSGWTTIAANELDDGVYLWDTSTVPCPDIYWMKLSVYDSIGQTTFDASNYSFALTCIPDNPPTITTYEPGGTSGQTHTQGDLVTVLWTAADDNPLPLNPINITFGDIGGWIMIASNEVNDGSYSWDTSAVPCPGIYWIRLSVYDSIGQTTFDVGNFSFALTCIPDNPPTITAYEPGGTSGQIHTQGVMIIVTWTASDDNPLPANPINITYGVPGFWTTMASNEVNDGSYGWDTSVVPCPGIYWVRLSVYDSVGQTEFDIGNYSFTMICPVDNPPTIEAWEPGGSSGQTHTQGDLIIVTWTAIDDNPLPANPINITYGDLGGWTTIAIDEANDGAYGWDTSAVSCPGTYWMRLSVYDSNGQTVFDIGNYSFDIICPVDIPPTIEAWEPGGTSSQTHTQGYLITVTWTANDDNLLPFNPINITYGDLGGWMTIATDEANDGAYNWDTSAVPCPGTYWMRLSVYDSIGQTTFDIGNFSFTIICPVDNSPTITAYEPGGTSGQSYTQGDLINVMWTANDDNALPPNPVNITYGDLSGWTTIVTDVANLGMYSWDTAGVPCPGTYLMRLSVYDSIGQTTFDNGNSSFEITCPDSPPTIEAWEPGGSFPQVYLPGNLIMVGWLATDDNPLPPNPINITYGDPISGWITIATNEANDGLYIWDTTDVLCGNSYWMRISVYDSIGQTTFATSNFSFAVNCPVVTTGTITGKVVDKEDGNPIEGAIVQLQDSTGVVVDTKTTNSTGDFEFIDALFDSYTLLVSKDGYEDNDLTTATISSGSPVHDTGDIELTPVTVPTTGTVEGTVYDSDGNPVEGATVELLDEDGNVVDTKTTDSNGRYGFENVGFGNYAIKVTKTGYEDTTSGLFTLDANNPTVDTASTLAPTTAAPAAILPEWLWLILLIILVVIIAVLAALLAMSRRKKPEKAAPPAPPAKAEEPPKEPEAPIKEEAPKEPEEPPKEEAAKEPEELPREEAAKESEEPPKEEAAKESEESSKEEAVKEPEEPTKEEAAKEPEEPSKEEAAKESEESPKEEAAKESEESSKEEAEKESEKSEKEETSKEEEAEEKKETEPESETKTE